MKGFQGRGGSGQLCPTLGVRPTEIELGNDRRLEPGAQGHPASEGRSWDSKPGLAHSQAAGLSRREPFGEHFIFTY